MLTGAEAVAMYRKGIEVLEGDQKRYETIFDTTQANLAKKQRASACACVADLYMTVPLCDEPDAEKTCES